MLHTVVVGDDINQWNNKNKYSFAQHNVCFLYFFQNVNWYSIDVSKVTVIKLVTFQVIFMHLIWHNLYGLEFVGSA